MSGDIDSIPSAKNIIMKVILLIIRLIIFREVIHNHKEVKL